MATAFENFNALATLSVELPVASTTEDTVGSTLPARRASHTAMTADRHPTRVSRRAGGEPQRVAELIAGDAAAAVVRRKSRRVVLAPQLSQPPNVTETPGPRPHRIPRWFGGVATVPGRALIDTLPLVWQVDVLPESWQLGRASAAGATTPAATTKPAITSADLLRFLISGSPFRLLGR